MAIDERSGEGVSPAALARPMAGARSPALHAVLLGATIFSATLAGVDVDPLALAAHPALLLRGLPFAATLVFILLVHESGHYVACLRHRVSAPRSREGGSPEGVISFSSRARQARRRRAWPA